MARQIIKQPDGVLYAEYSTIVDGFVATNLTAEDIIERRRAAAAVIAEREAREAIEEADTGVVHPWGVTWEEAVKIHNRRHPHQIDLTQTDQ